MRVSVNTGPSSARGERFLSPWKRIPGTPTGYANAHTHGWVMEAIGGLDLKREKKKKCYNVASVESEGPRSLGLRAPHARVSLFRERSANRGAGDRSRRGKADYKDRGILGGSIQ